MTELSSMALRSGRDGLFLLDQTVLPNEERWLAIRNPDEMIAAIKALKVRGAPLIGVAAALAVGHYSQTERDPERLRQAIKALREARPTAINLMYAMDRLALRIDTDKSCETLLEEAEKLLIEDQVLCQKIADNGAELLREGDAVITHCNTGGLATAGRGTALAVIAEAHRRGKRIEVYVDETRPLLQGGRLTTWELEKLEIPYTLICDNMAAMLMNKGKVQKAIVGSDRIAANGDFANKVGTYSLAVNAFYHRVPLYVAAPFTTVDLNCKTGAEIPIEERPDDEVRGFGELRWAPKKSPVFNPAFDVTPAELVSYWILDKGAWSLNEIRAGKLKQELGG